MMKRCPERAPRRARLLHVLLVTSMVHGCSSHETGGLDADVGADSGQDADLIIDADVDLSRDSDTNIDADDDLDGDSDVEVVDVPVETNCDGRDDDRDGTVDEGCACADGWSWEAPSPQGQTLRAGWFSSEGEGVFVGDFGAVVVHVDDELTLLETGISEHFTAVYAASSDALFIAGDSIWRYDGRSWESTPADSPSGLWGRAPDDVWATVEGAILHWDGTEWSQSLSHPGRSFHGLAGTPEGEVFALSAGRLFSYDGSTWSEHILSDLVDPADLLAISSGDVYVLQRSGRLHHFDGSDWSVEDISDSRPSVLRLGRTTGGEMWVSTYEDGLFYRGVSGWTASDAAHGRQIYDFPNDLSGRLFALGEGGAIMVYDGSSWTDLTEGSVTHLYEIHGADLDAIYAVGAEGTVLRSDGATWSRMETPTTDALYGVWAAADGEVFAVGEGGQAIRFDGLSWVITPTEVDQDLHTVWGSSSSDVFAGGDDGTIVHWDGSSWRSMPTDALADLRGLWGSGPSSVAAVGISFWDSGGATSEIVSFDGEAWSVLPMSGLAFNDVWGRGPDDIWVTGYVYAGGYIGEDFVYHYDGVDWIYNGGAGGDLGFDDVFGFSDGGLVVLAHRGVVRFDGSEWSAAMDAGPGGPLGFHGIWGSSINNVYIVGRGGRIAHLCGVSE